MQHKVEYLWAMVGKFLPQFIYLVTTMVLARFLTPDDFGAIGILAIFFTVANTLIDSGLGSSLVKEKEISELDCSTISVFNLVLSHVLYLIIVVFSVDIENYYEVNGLALIIKILCLIFIINAWGLVPQSLLVRELRFKTRMYIGIVSVVLSALVAIIMAILGCGVWSLVVYQLVGGAVTTIMSAIAARYKVSFCFSRNSFKRLFSFGFFTTLTSTIDTIYENLIVNIFGKYMSIQQAGLLYQAKRIEEVPTQTLATTISSVSFPVLTKMRFESKKFVEECNSVFKTVLLLVLPLLACLSLFSSSIITLLFGEQWTAAGPYLSLLVIAGVFRIAETLNRTFIKSITKVDKLLVYTIIKRSIGIVLLGVFAIFDSKHILHGYIISSFIGYFLNCILLSKVSDSKLIEQILLFVKIIIPSLIIYVVVLLSGYLIKMLLLQILLTIILIWIYYLFVLPWYGIDIISMAKNFVKGKQRI